MVGGPILRDVFGVNSSYRAHSYVDRGGLDRRLDYVLSTDRHVVIHGDSKQGKSWLRARALDGKPHLIIQCRPETTVEGLIKEALGGLGVNAVLKQTTNNTIEGTLEFLASAEAKLGPLAKLGVTTKAGGRRGRGTQVDSEPIGSTPADLAWVAKVVVASGRRLVVEDFHYLSEENKSAFAYLLKALGEYGVFPLIVGVWPQDHLLTYYNGDLDGRVEDVHLQWKDDELNEVLRKGSDALGISMSSLLRREMIRDCYANVGLLQRIAERLCIREGVRARKDADAVYLTVGESLDQARASVAESMAFRYHSFADNFVRGLRRLPHGLEVYRHLLQVLTASTDEQVLDGLDSAELFQRVHASNPDVRQSDLTSALERIDRLQARINISPAVLTYNRSSRRVFVTDRSFLYFRKYGSPVWPWDEDGFRPTNDLAAIEPLHLQ